MEFNEILERIDSLKNEINSLRPISPEIEQKIWQKFRLDWNFHSNNLEGNSLTFGETKSFLLHGITAEGKPLKDHLDIKGHNEAILLLDDILKEKRPITESFIRGLHEIILHEPYEKRATSPDGMETVRRIEIGQYKKTPNHVQTATGEVFYFASPEETPAMMNDLLDWYQTSIEDVTLHPLVIASEFHYRFVRIHPFDDGNGRMARILMNLILMKFGFPPVIIKTGDKANYFRSLQLADGGNLDAFYSYIGEQLISSEELFIKGAKGEDIQELDDVDKGISLLKARLEQETQKIIFEQATKNQIATDSIKPLLDLIFFKLSQFDDLYNEKLIILSFHEWLSNKNVSKRFNNYDKAVESFLFFLTKDNRSNLNIKVEWKDFIRTENKIFNTEITFDIAFRKYEFEINIAKSKEIFKVFYHRRHDENKFKKIASAIAMIVLNDIEKKLEE